MRVTIRDIMDIAARKRGVEGWYPYLWDSAAEGSIVTGAVPLRYYTKGKRKGLPDLTGAKRERVVVTMAEIEQAAADYERETSKCWDCKGTGHTLHDVCARCAGTGKAA